MDAQLVRPSLFCYDVLSKPPFHLQKRMRPENIMIYFRGADYMMQTGFRAEL